MGQISCWNKSIPPKGIISWRYQKAKKDNICETNRKMSEEKGKKTNACKVLQIRSGRSHCHSHRMSIGDSRGQSSFFRSHALCWDHYKGLTPGNPISR
ncbi:hypothetical protein CEXT_129151 [Caerostris extrusa]|uniref:Uncharacterized protein n=1 Tax=Caerostris extrusa TaxID=172846 RepID=A0AAV4XUQ3_CAEEX|nr:hypothetical protein CEXT_129151 [Caerostris extrusa]